jgi:DHH family
MHPTLQEYTSRFKPSNPTKTKTPSKFYTDFELGEHIESLPFIYDIENFVMRTLLAKLKNEKICIYADYDTDAVTATGAIYHGLLDLGYNSELLDFYTPDRFTEGYGINGDAIARLTTIFGLIISVDCGINSVSEATVVKDSKTCDLLITDHHHLHSAVPGCIGVINPRLSEHYDSSNLPKTNLKVKKELLSHLSVEQKTKLEEYLKRINTIKKSPNYDNYLTSSAVGVGVAWFCVVWLGYFENWLGI